NQLVIDTDGHNEFLTGKLAALLIDTALQIASKSQKANYSALRLLNIDFDKIDGVLTRFLFKETLLNKIKESEIFPTVNDKYVAYSGHPVYYENPVATLLNGRDV